MQIKKLAIIILAILFFIQTIIVGWLGIRLLNISKQLEVQREPVKTPAMIRNKI